MDIVLPGCDLIQLSHSLFTNFLNRPNTVQSRGCYLFEVWGAIVSKMIPFSRKYLIKGMDK